MRNLIALTKNTFRETIRDKILLVIVFFGIILIIATQLLSAISARQDEKIIIDLGLGLIDIFGLIITIFVGTHLIFREIDKKTIFILLSKPISRKNFLLSKFFGLGTILVIITIIMTCFFLGVVLFSTDLLVKDNIINLSLIANLGISILFSLFSFLLLLAIVIFFSSFMSPTLAAFSSLIIFVIGHVSDDLIIFTKTQLVVPEVMKIVAYFAYFGLPNFAVLNLKNFVLNDIALSPLEILASSTGAILWIFVAIFLGTIFFSRKEF